MSVRLIDGSSAAKEAAAPGLRMVMSSSEPTSSSLATPSNMSLDGPGPEPTSGLSTMVPARDMFVVLLAPVTAAQALASM